MSEFIAALPMYDWPERRAEVDAEWAAIRDRLRELGVDAPEKIVRRNADMPAVPGGIRDTEGNLLAPDPATLPPDELDYPTLWRHPKLLFGQTCWGPMKRSGLHWHVSVVGQPDYSDVEGGAGPGYSSAIVTRHDLSPPKRGDVAAPADGVPLLPLDLLRHARFACNELHSMSGYLALRRDLDDAGIGTTALRDPILTGSHRQSIRTVASGEADFAAIDCRTWALARRFEPAAREVHVVGWTARRMGLPFIAARAGARNAPAIHRVVPSVRSGEAASRRLIEGGTARADRIEGCGEEQIAMLEAAFGPLPRSYRAFLAAMGNGAGTLVESDIGIYAPGLAPLNAEIRRMVADDRKEGATWPDLVPENAFFIASRQTDYPHFLLAGDGEDSPVFMINFDRQIVERIADSVWDWLMGWIAYAEFRTANADPEAPLFPSRAGAPAASCRS